MALADKYRIEIIKPPIHDTLTEEKLELSTELFMRHKQKGIKFKLPFCNSVNQHNEKLSKYVYESGGLANIPAVDKPEWVLSRMQGMGIEVAAEEVYCVVFSSEQVFTLMNKMPINRNTLIGINCHGIVDSVLREAVYYVRENAANPIIVYGVINDSFDTKIYAWGVDYVFKGLDHQEETYGLLMPSNVGGCGYTINSRVEGLLGLVAGADMLMLSELSTLPVKVLEDLMLMAGAYSLKELRENCDLTYI